MADTPMGDKQLEKDLSTLEDSTYSDLLKQIEAERYVAKWHLDGKIDEWLRRLKLYNNQRRDKDKVGDPLLFTVFNTVLASLYDDRLIVKFSGREEGDQPTAENVNALAENDYDEMEKDILDYDWDWDTLFFGRGLVMFNTFDRDIKTPIPEVIDPTTFLRDPRAVSINGNKQGKGKLRFGGRELRMSMTELKSNPFFFNLEYLRFEGDTMQSVFQKAQDARRQAQGTTSTQQIEEKDLGDNSQYAVWEWLTNWNGKKVLVYFGNDGQLLIRYQVLGNKWPVIDRSLYPMAHDWDGTSIPDLVEDKQRHRAIIMNLSVDAVKSHIHPQYIYNNKAITNKNDLNVDFNKYVGVNGDQIAINNVIQPVNKADLRSDMVDYILNSLDAAAQRATATPELQQGVISKDQRTLGELNLVSSKVDTRYSLSAKIFGWSEKRFYMQWYWLYKKHFIKGIDEKIVRITGEKNRTLTKENIEFSNDPDIKIESTILREARRIREKNEFKEFIGILLQDPESNKRFAVRKLGELSGFSQKEITLLYPYNIDELTAMEENKMLSDNKYVQVKYDDDHVVHLTINEQAAETAETMAHLDGHREAMRQKKQNPQAFPQQQSQVTNATPGAFGSNPLTAGQGGLATPEQTTPAPAAGM